MQRHQRYVKLFHEIHNRICPRQHRVFLFFSCRSIHLYLAIGSGNLAYETLSDLPCVRLVGFLRLTYVKYVRSRLLVTTGFVEIPYEPDASSVDSHDQTTYRCPLSKLDLDVFDAIAFEHQ